MTENQRLKQLMELLGFKTQRAFAHALGLKQGSISDVMRRKDNMGVSNAIKKILESTFNVNREWLTYGIGEPILKQAPLVRDPKEGIPFYNVDPTDVDLESLIVNEEVVEYYVNYKPFNDCSAYLPVFGDSMYPRYAAGEIVAVKAITNFNVLQWGEAYLVITDDFTNKIRSIKNVHEHPDSNKLVLRSSNPNFKGDTVIDKKNIKEMYIIKGKITRNSI